MREMANLFVHLLLLSTCHSRGSSRTFYMFDKVEWGLCSSFNVAFLKFHFTFVELVKTEGMDVPWFIVLDLSSWM